MTFRPLTEPIDYIVLAGRRSPGIATIEGAATPRDFQERRGFGISFAMLRFRGVRLARFKVLLRLVTDEDWDGWHEWKDLVARPELESNPRRATPPGAFPRLTAPPMDIEHPILADLGVTSAVVEDQLQPVQSADGEWVIEIRFIEYRAPVIALERTEGAQARSGDNIENAIEANERAIALEDMASPAGRASL